MVALRVDAESSPIKHVLFTNMYLLGCFSGHGHHVKDINGDEDDGLDEALIPADYNKKKKNASMIIDDVIFAEVGED